VSDSPIPPDECAGALLETRAPALLFPLELEELTMTDLFRVRVQLTGAAVVGPSVMTLYLTSPATGFTAALTTWLNAIKANLPPSLVCQVPNTGDRIDEASGDLTGTYTDGTAASVTGTGVGGFAIGVGARVVWGTAGIVGGRRVRGTTFLVPLMGGTFDSSGRMQPATVTSLNTPTQTLIASLGSAFCIYSRHLPERVVNGVVKPERMGSSHPVTSATIMTNPTTLRSRRT
jgi:hypothetical protein